MKSRKYSFPLFIGLLCGWLACQPAPVFAVVASGGGGTTLTDSASLRSALSDETGGSGLAVFNSNPTLAGATLTGNLLFTDATYDIGASGATRPRHGYYSGNITAGGRGTFAAGVDFGLGQGEIGVVNNGFTVNQVRALQWGSNNNSSPDVFFYRVSAATLELEGSSNALGFLRHGRIVVNDTNGGTLGADDVRGQIYTNTGASGGQTFNLPAAVAGMHVTFLLSAADDVTINPDDADIILVVCSAAGDAYSSDATAGSRVELVAIDGTNWMVLESAGTWTDVN